MYFCLSTAQEALFCARTIFPVEKYFSELIRSCSIYYLSENYLQNSLCFRSMLLITRVRQVVFFFLKSELFVNWNAKASPDEGFPLPRTDIDLLCGRLWLRGGASVLLSEVHLFDSPGLHFEVSLGKILNPKLLLMCWSASRMAATAISV